MTRVLTFAAVVLSAVGLAGLSVPAQAAKGAPAAKGWLMVIQALPGASVNVAVDGKQVKAKAGVGTTMPMSLSTGSHRLSFSGAPGGRTIKTTVKVQKGVNRDVVLHRPAAVNGAPVVSTYKTPSKPIGPAKARVLLAHTATVGPADVRFDGQVVFESVANGEYADADVPAGSHRVALLPSGAKAKPILGPLSVDLKARTATMVYAVGNPKNGSMDVIAHTVNLKADGSTAPKNVRTGSAGLVRTEAVPFSTPGRASAPTSSAPQGLAWVGGALGLALVAVGVRGHSLRRARRASSAP